MGATTQSEPATAEPDPGGQLPTGRADPKELEAFTEPGLTDSGEDMSIPLEAPQPTPTLRSNLGLRKVISLPGWRNQATSEHPTGNRAGANLAARRAEEVQAAVRAQLEDAEARRVKLEQDLVVRVDIVRREAHTAPGVKTEVRCPPITEVRCPLFTGYRVQSSRMMRVWECGHLARREMSKVRRTGISTRRRSVMLMPPRSPRPLSCVGRASRPFSFPVAGSSRL